MRLFICGCTKAIHLISIDAYKEFMDKTPEYIDRIGEPIRIIGKLSPQSFALNRTNDSWKLRRESFLKEMGINQSSRFIPIIIDSCFKRMKLWKQDTQYNLLDEINHITFNVLSIILFGGSVSDKIQPIEFENKDGTIAKLSFADHFITLTEELESDSNNPLGLMFPFLMKYMLVQPFKRDKKNIKRFRDALFSYLSTCDDQESIFYKLSKKGEIHKDDLFDDLLVVMFAGHGTMSHGITSGIYLLKKNPDKKAKLMKELNQFD